MPIRGENIGTAYIRVIADGSGLDESIRRQFDESEPSVRDGAEQNARTYDEAFNKEIEKGFRGHWEKTQRGMFDDINHSFDQGLARLELSKKFFDGQQWATFRKRLSTEFGDAGRLAGQRLENEFRDSTNLSGLAARMRSIGPDIRRAQADVLRSMHEDALAMNAEFDRQLTVTHQNLLKQSQDYDKEIELHWSALARAGSKIQSFDKDNSKFFSRWHSKFDSAGKDVESFAGKIEKAFGGGARNNFFNFFGKLIGGAVGLLAVFPNIASKVSGEAEKMATAFTSAGGGISGMGAAASGLIPALGGIVAGGIGVAAVLGALIVILGPVIALLSGLLGIVVALASTVFFAAAAGAAALGGALAVLGIGLGAALLALSKLSKATSGPAVKAFADFKSTFASFVDEARQPIVAALPGLMDRLGVVVKGLGPLMHAAATGMVDFFNQIINGLQSGGFHQFEAAFTRLLPNALHSMGRSFSNVFLGITGLLRGSIPLVQSFLGWLQKITGEFARWANSRAGQSQIRDFLRTASTAAQSLVGFLGQAGGLLLDLITQGSGAGNHMFDGMTAALRNFRKFLTEPLVLPGPVGPKKSPYIDPNGILAPPKNRIQEWFDFAQQLADKLGEAFTNATKLMAALGDKHAQDNLIAILGLLNDMIILLQSIQFFNPFSLFGKIQDAFKGFHIPKFGQGFKWGDIIKPPNLTGVVSAFSGLGEKILKRIGHIDISGIIHGAGSAASSVVSPFIGMAGRLLGHIGPVNVAGIINGAVSAAGGLLGAFAGMAGRILSRISPVNVSGIISGAATAANNLVSAFQGLASRIVAAIGDIVPHVVIKLPSIPSIHIPGTAVGGIFDSAQVRTIAEAGREAVVPLDRPLSQVDPAVRWLSAIAQGLTPPPSSGGSMTSPGKSITVGELHVHTPATDPFAVANEAINVLAASGY